MVKLVQRMSQQFYSGNTGSPIYKWEMFHLENGNPNTRFMTRKNVNEAGMHTGIVLSAATCVWLPLSHQRLFDFLSDTTHRNWWDILTKTSSVETPISIQKANSQSNFSLLHILWSGMRVVQESWCDTSGAYMVYAPVETGQIADVLVRGAAADNIKILPSGFSILPDGVFAGGCLLSFGLQVLLSHNPTGELPQASVKTVGELIDYTIARIRSAFHI
ncbi:unnamed protein product [Microthlaspi erraticum]|uniref:HD-Zip IV C-terminal domain-containing protein n=1 Tax=Microthlaspi erraticum TaxID=1685480 RepID=A0A6D2L6U4_9BRAS|nr:unnamed protein product [Microthlaspi erraticum]